MADRERMCYSGIFFDGADLEDFRKWVKTGILGGATTNPVILKDAQVFDVPSHIERMIAIAGRGFPISVEIPDTRMTVGEMVDLGKRYRDKFPDNVVVKVPMDPRDSTRGFEAMSKLAEEAVRVNATLGLAGGQLIAAAEALRGSRADGDSYVSLFWARRNEAKPQIIDNELKSVDDEERVALENRLQNLVPDATATLVLLLYYLQTHGFNKVRVIVGSVRTPYDIDRAFGVGVDIVTIKPKLLDEWMYTRRGEETAEEFNKAYDSVRNHVRLI